MSRFDLPAILGGEPMRTEPLPLYNTIGEEEKRAVMEVLDHGELSGFIASPLPEFYGGPRVLALEKAFCEYFGCKHAVAMNSATAGLYCMLMAMGVGPGDEVITSPYTMHATPSSVLQVGCTPIFADIEAETYGLDPASVESRITERTKGILTVNLFGHPSRVHELKEVADRHGLWLLEDNAQSPAAVAEGAWAGSVGKAGVVSFNRHKTMQCGEGGVVVTDDDAVAMKMRLVRNHGESVVEAFGVEDIVNTMGQNLRLTEMEAAVAGVQFGRLPGLNEGRIRLADRITAGLADVDAVRPPKVRKDSRHVYYFYPMKFVAEAAGMPRDLFVDAVRAEGFYLRKGYMRPLYFEPLFQKKLCFGPDGYPFAANPRNDQVSYAPGLCPVCERIDREEMMLTNMLHPPLTERDMDDFVYAMKRVLAHAPQIVEKCAG